MMTTLHDTLQDIATESQELRRQLKTERRWRRLIAVALVLTVVVGVRTEVVRSDNEARDQRNACLSSNDARIAIRNGFQRLFDVFLADVPLEDPRHEQGRQFMMVLAADLPERNCG